LEAWEIVYVKEDFLSTNHGKIACVDCHGGNKHDFTKGGAHVNLVSYPSEAESTYCAPCHRTEAGHYSSSLHKNQNGYLDLFYRRAGVELKANPARQGMFNAECGKCHASCGQCHVSRPRSVNGGFLSGHAFKNLPSMQFNCTACHGSRVGEEYLGQRDEKADVHWEPNGKRCDFCHSAAEMHGNGTTLLHRYDANNTALPRCEDCHSTLDSTNVYHKAHWKGEAGETLSCFVCHSQPYKNCYSCHTGGAGIERPSEIDFKIGKNYNKSQRYPYDYITVRHIPIAPDTYAAWGVSTLPNYDSLPTWKMATPHNIQRWTAQTDTTGAATCSENCHDTDKYLRAADLESYEVNANQSVIIP